MKTLTRWQEIQRMAVVEALKLNGGNKKLTAKYLGIGRQTLYSYLNLLSINALNLKYNENDDINLSIEKQREGGSFNSKLEEKEEHLFYKQLRQIYGKVVIPNDPNCDANDKT